MDKTIIPILAALALFCYCVIAIFRETQTLRHHTLRVKKLYASPVFEDMLPILTMAKNRVVEQITIDKTGLLFTFLSPVGSHTAFLMKNHNYAYLTLEQQQAMETVLEECLPKLRDAKRYRHSCRRVHLVSGKVEYVFRYTIQNSYKTMLNRAPYYDHKQPEAASLRQ